MFVFVCVCECVREREQEGWREKRRDGGRRGLILPGLWYKLVPWSRKRYDGERERERERGSPTIPPSLHPSYYPSRSVVVSQSCTILVWIHQDVRSAGEGIIQGSRT